MASNNYAEVITDRIKAEQALAMFERLVTLGRTFKALEFNPDTDRFAISLGRESRIRTITMSTIATANDRREIWQMFVKPKLR